MNEEEIRGNLLLPYLGNLGFDASEISLEKSFSIRLGKSKHIIKGRSDILCKRNGKNLFIIELKNDQLTIAQEDIDQGISYARLLEDIAPFTIISNGKTTRVFDSITRKELTGSKISQQSEFWQNGCTLAADIDLKIRYEALKNFVSFSEENLKQFCETQVRNRMGPIIGNIDSPSSKFVQELHVQRQDLQRAFDNFIDSEASLFGIVGSAGVGKTGAMCSLALQGLKDKFVFFYNAAIINKSPLEHISQDLNGTFSSKSDSDIILKRLDELGRFLGKTVLIFIDAIDESTDPRLSLELSEIALSVRNLERVKICISCKLNIWKSLLIINGTSTHLLEELRKTHVPKVELGNCPGFLLENFSDSELKAIIPIYKKVFGFKGEISESLLHELRNGFFLRIFSEVYNQKDIPQRIDDKILIQRYIRQSLEKTNIGLQSGLRYLSKIGKIALNHNYGSWGSLNDDGIEVDNLLEELDLAVDETIPEDLFARNILIRSNKEDSYNVSFYYSKIRDYVICFHSYKLDKLSFDDFYNLLDIFYENHVGQSAIYFYTRNASSNHTRALIKFKKDKALKYVTGYENYLIDNFKNIKEKFDPETDGDIGIFLPEDLVNQYGYALFPLDVNSTEKVQFEKIGHALSDRNSNVLFFQKGVKSIHISDNSIFIPDQGKVIRKDVFKQLKEIVDKGRLNAYNSDLLLLELVSTILYHYSKKLGYTFSLKDRYLPRYDLIYPIDLETLRERVYKFSATHHYKEKGISRNLIPQKVEDAWSQNLEMPRLNYIGDFPPFEELRKIIDILQSRGYQILEKHHLPWPDKPLDEPKDNRSQNWRQEMREIRVSQFSVDQAKLYIESFFEQLESCYRDFVEYCFPTLKHEFTFYTSLPHEYFFYMKDSDVLKWGSYGFRKSRSGIIKVHIGEYESYEKAWKEEGIDVLRGFSLDSILHNGHYFNKVKTIDKINTEKLDDFCVLRNMVYRLLKDDMEKLFKENEQ